MTFKTALSIGLVMIAFPSASLATTTLTQGQASAKHSLHTYGYTNVDVTQLSPTQLAQIQYLAGSNSGVGRIRGQIGAVLRRSHVWDLSRKN